MEIIRTEKGLLIKKTREESDPYNEFRVGYNGFFKKFLRDPYDSTTKITPPDIKSILEE